MISTNCKESRFTKTRQFQRLRLFMHQRGDRHLSLVDMGAVVRGIVSAMTDEASRHGVDIHVDASLTLPVIADRVQIEQVLVNLNRVHFENRGYASPEPENTPVHGASGQN